MCSARQSINPDYKAECSIAEQPSLFAVKGLLMSVAVLGLATYLWMFPAKGDSLCTQKTRRKKASKNAAGNVQTINGNDISLRERHSADSEASRGSSFIGSVTSMKSYERRHLEKLWHEMKSKKDKMSTRQRSSFSDSEMSMQSYERRDLEKLWHEMKSKRDKMRTRQRRRRVSPYVVETNTEHSNASAITTRADAKLASRVLCKVEPESEARPRIGTLTGMQKSVQKSCPDLTVLGSMAPGSASASVSTSSSLPSNSPLLRSSIHNPGRRGALANTYAPEMNNPQSP